MEGFLLARRQEIERLKVQVQELHAEIRRLREKAPNAKVPSVLS